MMRAIRDSTPRAALLLFIAGALIACEAFDSEPDIGIYRAVIDTPAGELPFGLQIEGAPRAAGAGIAVFLLDGSERVALTEVSRDASRFDMALPSGAGTLAFTARGRRLSGTAVLLDASGREHELDFSAETGVAYRFFAEPLTDNADAAGRWSVAIAGVAGEGVFDLTQSHELVSGTYHENGGPPRTVTGQVHGDVFRLSGFKGNRAELWAAEVTPAGTLEGTYWSSLAGESGFSARRNPDAVVPGHPDDSDAEH